MNSYFVYLGRCEQFKYTYEANNLKDLKEKLAKEYMLLVGRWYKQPIDGCPTRSRRFIVKGRAYGYYHRTPILIIPERK